MDFILELLFIQMQTVSYCLNEKTLTGLITYSQDVTVSDIIISNSVIVGPRLIYYTAGNRVQLKDGFSVPFDPKFSAKMQTCIEINVFL